jgi:predicted enzyme related to lactoylglutathione lyase
MSISIYGTSFDAADAAAIAAFWGEALGRTVNPGATSESASLAASEGRDESAIMFHRVPEPKTVKNRLHLDLVTADFDAELARLLKLGATALATFERWTTLADPEGNEFDLIRG